MREQMVGRPLRRVEDPQLITGAGRYVDDLVPPGTVHVAFVRSPLAHARINSIDSDEARQMPGVVGVFGAGDLGFDKPMPNLYPAPGLEDSRQAYPLARDEVCYVGEAIVAVVADTAAAAVDAAETVFVDLEPLPATVDHDRALDEDAPPVHEGYAGNLVTQLAASFGDVAAAFESAAQTVAVTLHQHRGACAAMEPRGVLADRHYGLGELVVWSSTQSPFPLRRLLAEYLDLPHQEVRVVAPDVGGGFGPKAAIYAEEYIVAALAWRLERPVKWIETRREHFVATVQQRDQTCHMEAAVAADGRLLAVRARIIHDNGAYVPYGIVLPVTGLLLMTGPYVIGAFDATIDVVYTNKTPTGAIRGAGRPYAVFALERLIDAVADELGMDRAEIRRRNFVPPDRFPYETGLVARNGKPVTYDSGDYGRALDSALEAAEADTFEARREAAARQGRLRGLGVASYVEDTGLGPFEGARVEVLASGDVVVTTGAAAQGQGHATVFAQLCADELGVDPERVVVRAGDTGHYDYGIATVASRTAATAGSSVHLAAVDVAQLARELAAEQLEASPDDMILQGGMVAVAGSPDAAVSLAALAQSMHGTAATALPTGQEAPGLAAEAAFQLPGLGFAYGTHVAEVEIDPVTGNIEVVAYTVAHDCGTLLNPMIVDGQIDGGVAHGLGNALLERVAFDEAGQPLVTTFMDYRVMAAAEMPPLRKVHTETPSPHNPLGAKGAGEGGTIPAAATVAAAVDDALRQYGVFVDRQPLSPELLYQLIKDGSPA